jgi:hypothetical protein
LIVSEVALVGFEPEAVAVDLEDANVVGKAIEQLASEALAANTPVHSSKGRLLVTIIEPRS